MLNKDQIIKEFKNEEFIVRNAIYEYVCNLHLYDDEQINEALIDFIKNNYNNINISGLRFSKINKEIIQCLIDICLKEKDEFIKESIGKVLVNHYSLIKDFNYDFEKMLIDENDLLLYKKIKHFSKKNVDDLLDLFMNNIDSYYMNGTDTILTEIIRLAIGIAIIQTEEGIEKMLSFLKVLCECSIACNDYSKLLNIHMPYLVYPLCASGNKVFSPALIGLYFDNMDFIGYADECNYYFSSICDDDFVNMYLGILKKIRKHDREDYFYDICEYLDSSAIDDFLLGELKRIKDEEIRENIIRILASKFNDKVIPLALEFAKNDNFYDAEGFKLALAPLLVLQKINTDIAKDIIKCAKEEFYWVK